MSTMSNHTTEVLWHYVVPPANVERVVITQRRDGPFRSDKVGGVGHYYTSREQLVRGKWQHVSGSANGGFRSFEQAYAVAEQAWHAAIAKGTGAGA